MRLKTPFVEISLFAHLRWRAPIARGETVELLLAHFGRGNVDQFIRAGIADEDGDFVVGGFAPMLFNELGDGGLTRLASRLNSSMSFCGTPLISNPRFRFSIS